MFYREKIGIIGLGFVGNAIKHSYLDNQFVQLIEIDLDPYKGCVGSYNDLKDAIAVFICVPSPQHDDGSCNTEPLKSTLEQLKNFKGVIISKVTAPPDVYEELQLRYCNLVHIPEFLTASNAIDDYISETFAVVGGEVSAYINEAIRVIKLGQPSLKNIERCSIGEASLTKYVINCFLATKVVFMNEMANLASVSGQDWNRIRQLISLDKRIGNSHTQVPGPDGLFGFGGICFPKDTLALIKYAESKNQLTTVLHSAVQKNLMLRLSNSK